jgi:hypothetical protein
VREAETLQTSCAVCILVLESLKLLEPTGPVKDYFNFSFNYFDIDNLEEKN